MDPDTVLIIDDNIEVLENTAELLKINGYIVLTADNGDKGIKIALQEKPNLVISDIMMRDTDGYDVFNALKKNNYCATIPFVFLTANTEKREMRKSLSIGANAFLTKPYDADTLIKVIAALLHKEEIEYPD